MKGLTNATSLTTVPINDGYITRRKLSSDALYAPAIAATEDRVLSESDIGAIIYSDAEEAVTITIPAHENVALPIGTEIGLIRYGAGDFTINCIDGVSVYTSSDGLVTSKKIANRYGMASLKQLKKDVWILSGEVE